MAAQDEQFEDDVITKVDGDSTNGWSITRESGWSFFVGSESPIAPTVGMKCRFYGKGIGYPVRGLFLDGVEVFYRTEEQQKEHFDIEMYGKDAADWLARWDAGKTVWSIEMGGLGPGYEQCIHIVCAEVLRWLLANDVDIDKHAEWRDELDKALFANPAINALGLSGAQAGAGKNIAYQLYRHGPRGVMNDERVKDRHIQVNRSFPEMAVA